MKTPRPRKLNKIRREAIRRIAKTEQLQIRLDAQLWDALFKLSGKLRMPLSSMVRDWIKERLAKELAGSSEGAPYLNSIEERLCTLESKVLRKSM